MVAQRCADVHDQERNEYEPETEVRECGEICGLLVRPDQRWERHLPEEPERNSRRRVDDPAGEWHREHHDVEKDMAGMRRGAFPGRHAFRKHWRRFGQAVQEIKESNYELMFVFLSLFVLWDLNRLISEKSGLFSDSNS